MPESRPPAAGASRSAPPSQHTGEPPSALGALAPGAPPHGDPAALPLQRRRLRLGVGAVILLGLVGFVIAVLAGALGGGGGSMSAIGGTPAPASPGSTPPAAAFEGSVILVHVLGEVQRPGLYELPAGARAVDAVAAAGGLTEEADTAQVNLARFLVDAEQLIVPAHGDEPETPGAAAGTGEGTVNLNTADVAALDTLPGVGPSTAEKIIAWREENGRFASVEDLLNVSGIGDAKFAELRDRVSL